MYTKEQRRLLKMLNGVVKWKKGKKQARLQKRRLIRRIQYWEFTKRNRAKLPAKSVIHFPAPATQQHLPTPMEMQLKNTATEQLTMRSFPSKAHTLDSLESQPATLDIDIFRFPIIDWDYRWQRPQQLCQQFAQHGYRVFYFSIESEQINNRNADFEEIRAKLRIEEKQNNVWLVTLCSYSRLNAYRDTIKHPLDKQYLKWSIEALKQRFGIHQTVTIVDLPFWSTLVFELDHNKVIYDCMDEHAGFSNTSAELLALEPNLLSRSDAVVTSSDLLCEKAKQLNSSVHLIRNAGDYKHFAEKPSQLPSDISNVRKPVIGYIGAIADWFDMGLVHELAERNPNWDFVLIGNTYYSDTSKVEMLSNVFLLGEKPYSELPAYLHQFDVCLIPFYINQLTMATNPVKIYEYLAAGKPVVSTELPELNSMQEYVALAKGAKEFEAAIWEALQEQNSMEHAEKVEKRRLFAANNTWADRYEDFQAIIMNELYPKVSIIVVTHNNWNLTRRCIDSLLRYTDYPRLEIILVDNASTDETTTHLLKLQHPHIKTILLSENTGFAGGNIVGTLNATGDYVVLLNNDTIVAKEWLPRLLRPFTVDDKIGAVGPVSNFVGNDQKLDFFVGDEIQGANEAWLNEFHELYNQKMRYSEMLGFFCVAIKKTVFAKIGHLDKNFGYGMFEDDDYCLRMQQAGYRLAVAEDAFVFHQGNATFKQWNEEQKSSLFTNNRTYFEAKWGRSWELPKMPLSLFINQSDPDKIAEIVAASGKSSVFVYCPDHWGAPKEEWQHKLLDICNEQTLVIALVKSYFNEPIHGIRKIGPHLYFTNNEQLLEKTNFDFIYSFTHVVPRGEFNGDAS